METIKPFANLRRVYCAGPLFNGAERREMEEIAEQLRHDGFETFVPHADGMEFSKVRPFLIQRGWTPDAAGRLLHEAIFALDTYHVVANCGSLVFNMNGRVPDEGAVAEMTMAWMLGKPLVVFKDDVRSLITGRDNPLLLGQTRFETVRELSALAEALEVQIAPREVWADQAIACPPHVGEAVFLGKRLWEALDENAAKPDDARIARVLVDLFARGEPPELQTPEVPAGRACLRRTLS